MRSLAWLCPDCSPPTAHNCMALRAQEWGQSQADHKDQAMSERDQEMAQMQEHVERMELQRRAADRLQAERMEIQPAAETDRFEMLRPSP